MTSTIITDNGSQFASTRFREFCANYGIQLRFSSVAHPQTNGLAEVTNRSILDGLRRRVSTVRSAWVDELPSILGPCGPPPKPQLENPPTASHSGPRPYYPPKWFSLPIGRKTTMKGYRPKDYKSVSTCSKSGVLTRT
ncbi:uncharacterized protein LOC135620364 [Musa acuminata AAA Group]|uniref:uncharacterized protein LOC135620364 n=1 Tax=Musa acuminata AAA Group TaxID=214697 RepID=UPI0031D502A5